MMKKRGAKNFHSWSVRDIEHQFKTDASLGLSENFVTSSAKLYGINVLENKNRANALVILFRQFSNFFIILLVIACAISYFVDGLTQAIILAIVIALNVILGFFQEYKADRALAELKRSFMSESRVLRDGNIKIVPSEQIVVGDVVILEQGDKVPADIRLAESVSMRVNQASLTGESLPISKISRIVEAKTDLADRKNMAWAGTMVVAGRGKGIVVGVGKNTEFGQIAKLISGQDDKTPLEIQIAYLGKIFALIAIIMCAIVFALGWFRGYEIWPLLTLSIALLVAAVPESLPTVVTMALSTGVSRMARKNAIVRKLASVETLGTTNIIATDKTGTLTTNMLTVSKLALFRGSEFELTEPTSRHHRDREVYRILLDGILCSNVSFSEAKELVGDPVEVAIANKVIELKHNISAMSQSYKRLMEKPFDSDKKCMSVLVESDNKEILITKGAPETIIDFCHITPKLKQLAKEQAIGLSAEGYKVIAIAKKYLRKGQEPDTESMDLIGFFAMSDEPAPGVEQAIKNTIRAGIRPIMITGDHPETAKSIANQVGFEAQDSDIILGEELERLNDQELGERLKSVKIFARVLPEQKYLIVKKLMAMGYSVAVTGDGVNDAPALKEAQVGIAMGKRGSDVARDSADIVLLDDQYETIVSAIEYGRTIFDNIKNTIIYLLASNAKLILLVGISFGLGLPAVLITLQILWINMITDALPAVALGLEKPTPGVIRESPRPIGKDSLRRPLMMAMAFAVVSFAFSLMVYLWGLQFSPEKARTLVFCFIITIDLLFAFSIRSKKRLWQSLSSFFENKFLIVSILLSGVLQIAIFHPSIRQYFGVVPLNINEIIYIIASAIGALVLIEIIRAIFDRKNK